MAQFSRARINSLTYKVIAAAIEVHRHLGPGLLETVYQRCMEYELTSARLPFEAGRLVPVVYKSTPVAVGLRVDFWIDDLVIVELKAIEALAPVHDAQLLTYLKLTGAPIGLLINFNVPSLRKGLRRMLNKDHELVDPFNTAPPTR